MASLNNEDQPQPGIDERDYRQSNFVYNALHNDDDDLETKKTAINDMLRIMKSNDLDMQRERDMSEFNSYASTKSVSQELLNTTTIQFLIGTLVSLFVSQRQPYSGIAIAAMVVVSLCLTLQVIVFILIALIYKETNLESAKAKNSLVTTLSTVVLITNIAVTVITSRIPGDSWMTNSTQSMTTMVK